jgi:hypothetical protein
MIETYITVDSSRRELLRFEPMGQLFNHKIRFILGVSRVIPLNFNEVIGLAIVSLVLF